MLTKRNLWATYKDALICWFGELPSPAELGMERVFDFTHRILAIAEREQVMRVIESPDPWSFKREAGWTWLDSVRKRFEQTGAVILFPGGGPTFQAGGRLRLPALLAYYRGNQIVEEDVEDPGLLLRTLQPDDNMIGRHSTVPFWLGGCVRSDESLAGRPPNDAVDLTLMLHTDIWFPRVVGVHAEDYIFDGNHLARGHDGMMDNSALAVRHTPRLNRFIQTLREAILELGGTWTLDRKGADSRYLPMLHESGINLDYPTASA